MQSYGSPKAPLEFSIARDHLDAARAQINETNIAGTLFIVPDNDGEARRAQEILRRLKAPHFLASRQKWGATLEKEDLAGFLKPGIRRVAIFEIPGPAAEAYLVELGFEVVLFDHHAYNDFDRSRPDSSLEQLMSYLNWPANRTDMAIAINDRGYIPGLKSNGFTAEEITRIREFDLVAQGRNLSDVRALVSEARRMIPGLPRREGIFVLERLHSDEGILKQEIALLSPDGLADTFDIKTGSLGFSGSPAAVRALLAHDFGSLGYAPRDFKQYGGGDPKASMFWGFKVAHKPAGASEKIPRAVVDKVFSIITGAKARKLS